MKRFTAVLLACVMSATVSAADRIPVSVIERTEHRDTHCFSSPGTSTTVGASAATCRTACVRYLGDPCGRVETQCEGGSRGTTITTPPSSGCYDTLGMTLSIRLPDTRLLVAVCSDKTEFLRRLPRDCRVPPAGADVFMELKGESVKLHWREVSGVTLDKKKYKDVNETYRILSVSEKW